jgi:hypothetical protein
VKEKKMKTHLMLESYTGQNVINRTIQSTWTDLGIFNNAQNINLTAIEQTLAHYVVPAGTPQYLIDLAQGTPQFILHVEPVQVQHGHEPVQLVGHHPHHIEV